MKAYILGAGASLSAGYPLASQLLHELSVWLDHCDNSIHWVPRARNRIVQLRETFGSLDDFEGLLRKLEEYGDQRVRPTGPTTYPQDWTDIVHDCLQKLEGGTGHDPGPAQGFYPQNLRSDLISAFREFFYETAKLRTEPNAYGSLVERKADPNMALITFNYDVARERALARANMWDIGDGYGFTFLPDRPASKVKVYKLHGSVNWFKHPIHDAPPPVIFTRDLQLLGYQGLVDPRVGGNGMGVDNSGTFILPDPRKKFYWEQFWEPLWNAASEQLRGAQEVFVCGYSMPAADARARQLLFDSIEKSAMVNIYCRSTSDRIASEFYSRRFTHVRSCPAVSFEAWAAGEEPIAQ